MEVGRLMFIRTKPSTRSPGLEGAGEGRSSET